ncbi:RluA family pseudouridine synthase, partial [Bacillus cereus]|nr:RluA family pseudouridine synthase [Bacillus cereus]
LYGGQTKYMTSKALHSMKINIWNTINKEAIEV